MRLALWNTGERCSMRLQATDPDIETLIARIERSDVDLQPDFQRGEIWSIAKKRKLIDSILRDWHVPPIHIVVRGDGIQEVLDGQQRLAAIRDFVRNEFPIDGTIEPRDSVLEALDGRRYRDLPPDIRRRFNSFTIRTFLLTDYRPEEPGELFFRLNQISSLTSAEQRNAFYGESRDQVRDVVNFLSTEIGENHIGFSNKRMAYDDVVSKFLYHCESGKIGIKTTASDLSQRFRDSAGFNGKYVSEARDSLLLVFGGYSAADSKYKINKAVLLSLMLFAMRANRCSLDVNITKSFIRRFTEEAAPARRDLGDKRNREQVFSQLVRLFVDRASFRVSDVSSVVARDVALWGTYVLENPQSADGVPSSRDYRNLEEITRSTKPASSVVLQALEKRISDFSDWGRLDEKG